MQIKSKIVRIPIFWKFALMSIIIVTIFGFINLYMLWSSVYTSFEKEIDKRCKVLAKIVSDKALTPMVYEDNLSLYNILDEIKQSDPSISYIFILNNANHLVAQTYDIKLPEGLVNANSVKSKPFSIKVIRTNNYKYPVIRDIAYPILNGEIGTVRLGIVEEHIQQEIDEATSNLLIMIFAFLAIGLIGALVFSYLITAPIKRISQYEQIIDLNYIGSEYYIINDDKRLKFLNIEITDELNVLETKFSEMVNRLGKNYGELKETQKALIQAERLASLGTLSAGVAHEINNPISGIKNCTNRIIKDPQNTEQNLKYISLIKEATDKIENVVRHLLKFSRKQDIVLSKLDLNTVIESALSLTSHKLKTSQINTKIDCKENCFVNGSANHLEQVLVNLIINGLDSIMERKESEPSHKGEIKISVQTISDKTYIHVTDNGLGIPTEIQNKIFDPFFTSKEVGKGTGLGLSVSFTLIKKHNGKIQFSSKPGQGTEFVIELPLFQKMEV